jgi:hypothetical protein
MDAFQRSNKHAVVVVHGVGSTQAGEMLRQFVGDLGGPIDDTMFGEETFKHAMLNDHDHISEAYEVFWADLKPQIHGPLSLVAFFFKVNLALSQIGAEGWRGADTGANSPSRAGRLLKNLLFGFVLAAPALFLTFLHIFAFSGWLRVAGLLLAVGPVLAVAWSLRGCDKAVWISVILAPAFAIGAILASALGALDALDASGEPETAILAAWIIGGIQTGAFILVTVATLETAWHSTAAWIRTGKFHLAAFVVRATALGLPFALLAGGGGAVLWTINLALYSKQLHLTDDCAYHVWTTAYAAALPYDLAFMELVLAGATAAFGLYLSFGLFLFFARLKLSKWNNKRPPLGDFLRRWLKSSLFFFVALSILVGMAYIANLFLFPRKQIYQALPWLASLAHLDVFAIYAASSMRLLGFLPSTVGPLRLGLRIAADVVFYIVPAEGSTLAMAARAQNRFRELIVGLCKKFKDRILIIAYSQGSMIAANALPVMESGETQFITAGSPIDTLYWKFLGIDDKLKLSTWKNFYRASDFIGGPIREALGGDIPVVGHFDQHHMNYLSEPELRDAIAASCRTAS